MDINKIKKKISAQVLFIIKFPPIIDLAEKARTQHRCIYQHNRFLSQKALNVSSKFSKKHHMFLQSFK